MAARPRCPRCKDHPTVVRAYVQQRAETRDGITGKLTTLSLPYFYCGTCENVYAERDVLRDGE